MQLIKLAVVREFKDELVHHTTDANSVTNELSAKFLEDETVATDVGQIITADATS